MRLQSTGLPKGLPTAFTVQVESHDRSSEADFGVAGEAGGVVVELAAVPTHEAVCNALHFEHLSGAVH